MATADEIKIRIIAKDEASKVFNQTKSSSEKLKSSITALKASFIGLSVAGGAFLKSVIDTGSQVQNLQVRMKFLTGSTKQGTQAFQAMLRYASKVPFALEDIQLGVPSLLTVSKGTEELNELLEMTGDLAAASGLSFQETSMQMQRALAGGIASAELFRERGISAMLGFEAGVSYSAEQTKTKLISAFRDGTTTVKGASLELANTFTGQVSMMQDAWFNLKNELAKTGVLSEATNIIKDITAGIKDPKFQEGVKSFTENMLTLFRFIVENKEAIAVAVGAMYGFAKGGLAGAAKGGVATGIFAFWDEIKATIKDVLDQRPLYQKSIQELKDLEQSLLFQMENEKDEEGLKKLRQRLGEVGNAIDFVLSQKQKLTKVDKESLKVPSLIGVESVEKIRAKTDATTNYYDAIGKGIDDYVKKTQDLKKATQDAALKGMKSLEDAMVDVAMGTRSLKDAFKDMARSIIADIIRIQIKESMLASLGKLGGGAGITAGGTGLITGLKYSLGGLFATPQQQSGSFAGGGYTGNGARSGGVDGKGGFPAILHPQESVIDHYQGQSGGVTINQTINVSTGVQQTVRTEIMGLMPQIASAAKGAVLDARRRGGSFAGAF